MPMKAIVSYDDTLNDHDALALARVLAGAGAELSLVYVRHTTQVERSREELEEDQAMALLERGARWLGDLEVRRTVVVSASTGEGLRNLARREEADIVVFGSDYRTAAGHVAPQRSAQLLLDGGPAAVAIAPGNYGARRDVHVGRIGVLAGQGDTSALSTAGELAHELGAQVTNEQHGIDLLVMGSRPEAPEGRVMLTAQAQNTLENAVAPVLVVPRGVTLHFGQSVALA